MKTQDFFILWDSLRILILERIFQKECTALNEKVKSCEEKIETLTSTNDQLSKETNKLRDELVKSQDRMAKINTDGDDSIEKLLGLKVRIFLIRKRKRNDFSCKQK